MLCLIFLLASGFIEMVSLDVGFIMKKVSLEIWNSLLSWMIVGVYKWMFLFHYLGVISTKQASNSWPSIIPSSSA